MMGDSATLRCNYTRVDELSHLMLRWTFTGSRDKRQDKTLWAYLGTNHIDVAVGVSVRKYERVPSDIHSSHVIRVNNVTLEDEGKYQCKVEYPKLDAYFEKGGYLQLDILGKNHLISM